MASDRLRRTWPVELWGLYAPQHPLWQIIRSYRNIWKRSLASDLLAGETKGSPGALHYRVDWEHVRNETLKRYFRRYAQGRCTVAAWNALNVRFCRQRVYFGKGSRLVMDDYHSRPWRITPKRLLSMDGPNLWAKPDLLGMRYSFDEIERRQAFMVAARRKTKKKTPKTRRPAPDSMLPSVAQLYRHWDAAGRLLYIGISNHHVNRLSGHRATATWYPLIASVTIEHFESREAARRAEVEAIRAEKPIYNVAHNEPCFS